MFLILTNAFTECQRWKLICDPYLLCVVCTIMNKIFGNHTLMTRFENKVNKNDFNRNVCSNLTSMRDIK